METKRFISKIKCLRAFKDKINVVCPNCNGMAQLLQSEESKRGCIYDKYEFQCNNCFESIKEEVFYNHTIKRNCPDCGNLIQFSKRIRGEKRDSISVKCNKCESRYEYEPNISESKNFWFRGQIVWFEYWYQINYKSKILWALNLEDLKYLEDFIVADLRERSLNKYGMMLTERLPKWLQSGKNRESLLKTIKKLKEKV